MNKIYRQGDVLLISMPPAQAKKIQGERKDLREKGRVVLAHGEVTGHAHVILSGKETGRGKGTVEFEEIEMNHQAAKILSVKGRAAELRHDEHSTIVIPRGTYRVIRQREYSPESIRRVAD